MPGSFTEESSDDRVIVMWSGTLDDIPSGWALCDGNNGTPDLTGRFLSGTSDVTNSPGRTDGEDWFKLDKSQLPAHSHVAFTSYDGDHTHEIPYSQDYRYATAGSEVADDQGSDTAGYTESAGAHEHGVNMYSTGGDEWIENRPRYYELAFITPL